MIKLFRKIRQNLISQNRVGKYLLYAFGEIILVIIGILIALNLNKQSEQKQVEAKIDAIMVDVLEELGSNIENTNALINFYKTKDTVFYLVLNDKLTYDDYANPKMNGLSSALSHYRTIELIRYAFDNLILNMDAIPSKYEDIVKELNSLHTARKNTVDSFSEFTKNMINNNLLEQSAKFSWYSLQTPFNENKEKIDYMLNDYVYKNKVMDYQTFGIGNQLKHTMTYRTKATDIYQKIAVLLNKPVIHKSFKINDDVIKTFAGEWKNIDDDSKFKIVREKGRFYLYDNSDKPERDELFVLSIKQLKSKTVINSLEGNTTYVTNIFDGDTLVSKANSWNAKYIRVKN